MMRYTIRPLLTYEDALAQAKLRCEQILTERSSGNPDVMQRRLTAYLALADLCGSRLPKMVWSKTGKPYFADAPLFCSISHTDTGVAAVVADVPVGIDLQVLTDRFDRIAERVCSDTEKAALLRETDPMQKKTLFARIWSGKEAAVKVSGVGLGKVGIKNITVDAALQTASIGDTRYILTYLPSERIPCVVSLMKKSKTVL